MVFSIQHLVSYTFALQHFRYAFGILNRYRTNQHRLIFLMTFNDFCYHRVEFAVLALVDHVRHVQTLVWFVRRNLQNFQTVDFLEFLFFRLRSTCHTAKLAVHPEIVLEGDRSQRHALVLYFDLFLRFDRLVQPVAVSASSHQTAGKFIDDDNLITIHYIVYITAHNYICLERLDDMMVKCHMAMVIKVLNTKSAFSRSHALLCQSYRFHFNIYCKVFFSSQFLHEAVCSIIQFCRFLGLSGNNKRSPRFID
ncbi:hypothetical protein D3C75_785950 [compost metagenome]